MKATREDMAQAALTVQRYCEEHINQDAICDCPCGYIDAFGLHNCALYAPQFPMEMELDEFLRTRGLDNGKV